jgi:hypothetical protein
MRVMFMAVGVLAGLLGGTGAGKARPWYPWCAQYVSGIPIDCAYVSHDQCMQTVSGVSGFCTHNPAPPPPAPSRRHQRAY